MKRITTIFVIIVFLFSVIVYGQTEVGIVKGALIGVAVGVVLVLTGTFVGSKKSNEVQEKQEPAVKKEEVGNLETKADSTASEEKAPEE